MSKKSLILVIIQFTCFAFFAFDGALYTLNSLVYLQFIGFAIAVWGVLAMKLGNFNVQPEVKKTATIVTSGPYKIIRNPMYSGIILFFVVSVIGRFSILRLSAFLILTTVLILKIYMEEDFLAKHFGKDYLNYKEKTYRLIPFIY